MTKCSYCNKGLVQIQNDFLNRKYHKKCFFVMRDEGLLIRVYKEEHYGNGRFKRHIKWIEATTDSSEEE